MTGHEAAVSHRPTARESELSNVYGEGIIAGMLGAATVALWFLIVDTVNDVWAFIQTLPAKAWDAIKSALNMLLDIEIKNGVTVRDLVASGAESALNSMRTLLGLAGDWWKDRYVRDYWRCEDPDGEGTLMLYHDYSSGSAWFVQGWYD